MEWLIGAAVVAVLLFAYWVFVSVANHFQENALEREHQQDRKDIAKLVPLAATVVHRTGGKQSPEELAEQVYFRTKKHPKGPTAQQRLEQMLLEQASVPDDETVDYGAPRSSDDDLP